MSPTLAITSTRDLKRFRPLPAPALSALAGALFTLLAADTAEGASLRTAFVPAVLQSSTPPRPSLPALDAQIRELFVHPPAVVVVQGVIAQDAVDRLWADSLEGKNGDSGPSAGVGHCVYLAFALHTEIQRAAEEGESVEEANLSIMVIATLAHELAHWIYTKLHGYKPRPLSPSTTGLYARSSANASSASFASMHALVTERDRADVGDQASTMLLGCDLELLTYSIGERQLVKRRVPTRRSALLTPPLIYQLTHQSPQIFDVTSQPQSLSNTVPAWKEGDSMYAVVSALSPAGTSRIWGMCSVEGMDRRGSTFSLSSRGDRDDRRMSGFETIAEDGRRASSATSSD